MIRWIRYEHGGAVGFGSLDGETIEVHDGDMFAAPRSTGRTLGLGDVRPLAPTTPSKILALWNNSHLLAAKLGTTKPTDPLYLMKAPSSVAAPDADIPRPAFCAGKIVFEGELGIVIGAECHDASPAEAEAAIFGYTCVNDVTAADLINADPSFAQWVRAKSFDRFCPFGPTVASGIDPTTLTIRTRLNGSERQNYPATDLFFSGAELVSRLSRDMTLLPGDLICCGTSVGVGSMKGPVDVVEVEIDGIGTLRNRLVQ